MVEKSNTKRILNESSGQTVSDPRYFLDIGSEDGRQILLPASRQTQHSLNLAPQEKDQAHFTVYPVSGGWVTMTAHVTATLSQSPSASTKAGWDAAPVTLQIPVPSQEASIIYIPTTTVEVAGVEAGALQKLFTLLEAVDMVTGVHHNAA